MKDFYNSTTTTKILNGQRITLKQEKEIKSTQIGREEAMFSLFADERMVSFGKQTCKITVGKAIKLKDI